MGTNLLGKISWAVLGLLGLFSVVDLGFGPIVICPQCTRGLAIAVGVIVMALAVGAFATNRGAARQ